MGEGVLVLTNKDMEDKIEPRLVADGPHGLELKGKQGAFLKSWRRATSSRGRSPTSSITGSGK